MSCWSDKKGIIYRLAIYGIIKKENYNDKKLGRKKENLLQ